MTISGFAHLPRAFSDSSGAEDWLASPSSNLSIGRVPSYMPSLSEMLPPPSAKGLFSRHTPLLSSIAPL
ncbi:hypothetical protein CTheo_9145 [Ceratobasidium theobromae]|uniref:Uncharacterized protein n=1 Tax=Ceratobasidium theobromae TaxID=1582974 RepID=A0A5N5Q7P7_9AGAM|nr:hypothetical protein CTheo_9145 [Ceratobasidium theobromae]